MSKLNKRAGTGYHLSSDFFDSLQRTEKIFNLRGFSQVNSTWKKWKSTRCCNRLNNKKIRVFVSLTASNFLLSGYPTFRSSTCSSFNEKVCDLISSSWSFFERGWPTCCKKNDNHADNDARLLQKRVERVPCRFSKTIQIITFSAKHWSL